MWMIRAARKQFKRKKILERSENSLESCFLECVLPVLKLLTLPETTHKGPFYFLRWIQVNVLGVLADGLGVHGALHRPVPFEGSLGALAELL